MHPLSLLLVVVFLNEQCHGFAFLSPPLTRPFDLVRPCCSRLHLADPVVIIIDRDDGDDGDDNEANDDKNDDPYEGDEDEEEEEDLKKDPYTQVALSEFNSNDSRGSSDLALLNDMTTTVDWGGALGKLRQRFDDISQGKSGNPSQALFRLMSAQSPNQSIGSFVETANPQVVQAMSGTISSLLGGLSNPASGVETIVKATGDKIGSLCFQLQMTGYVEKVYLVVSRLLFLHRCRTHGGFFVALV